MSRQVFVLKMRRIEQKGLLENTVQQDVWLCHPGRTREAERFERVDKRPDGVDRV